MKLEVGKYYEGLDGNKYGPMEQVRRDVTHPWQETEARSSHIWKEDGTSEWVCDPNLVAEWKEEDTMKSEDTPVLWKDMTPEEKGALLLAHHEGKAIEHKAPGDHDWHTEEPLWINNLIYRVKPKEEPKRETVYRYGSPQGGGWLTETKSSYDTHKITFDTIDGRPDCSSITMEEID